jgi:hypothetical protein
MVTRPHSVQQYNWLNARETMQRLVGNSSLPVATNDLRRAASVLQGDLCSVGGCSLRDAGIIVPPRGLPKLFIAARCDGYRDIAAAAYEELGISIANGFVFDVDHALAKTLALGRFEYILMNPVSPLANRSFGAGIEKGSKNVRTFLNPEMELASIAEALKIAEVAPLKLGNLAEDCLIGIINALNAGFISRNQVEPMLDTIRDSHNNLVLEAYTEVKPEFEKAAKEVP